MVDRTTDCCTYYHTSSYSFLRVNFISNDWKWNSYPLCCSVLTVFQTGSNLYSSLFIKLYKYSITQRLFGFIFIIILIWSEKYYYVISAEHVGVFGWNWKLDDLPEETVLSMYTETKIIINNSFTETIQNFSLLKWQINFFEISILTFIPKLLLSLII